MHRRPVYIYLFNVPSFSSRHFNKIKRTSRLGRLLALSLEILYLLHIGKPNFYNKGVAINNLFNLNGTDLSTVQRTHKKVPMVSSLWSTEKKKGRLRTFF